jgi:hypothetical protein
VTQALGVIEKEKDALANELAQLKQEKQSERQLAEAKLAGELQRTAAAKDAQIQALKAQLDSGVISQQLAVTQAVSELEKNVKRYEVIFNALSLKKVSKKNHCVNVMRSNCAIEMKPLNAYGI